ncbi:hypothetical protein AC84_4862 [Escherichia coli 1-392-07_S4_C1]|uniref:Uncharacterized protein n=1 Tax=Escherichia coli 2-460-02_S1_C1 TaxID=1444044 RepID=A0A836Z983_ECOLX|nr:hypothetical protein AC88_4936 [Escherichia coli 3-267-03_S4_C1]KEN62426.1 hypothetical protein AD40_5029 [Escherichia coli 1-392-07_S4_C3]KEN95201.1 hypothetical protein AC84_4862 [Escherichia coli 1-392-07_S4_C1]KEO25008.1 hypothetical protein AB05_4983 [Escherichia coli 2-460-02_S1_C1]
MVIQYNYALFHEWLYIWCSDYCLQGQFRRCEQIKKKT